MGTGFFIFILFCILFYFAWTSMLSRRIKKIPVRNTISVLGAILMIPVSVLFAYLLNRFIENFYIPQDFDKKNWTEQPLDRYKMSDDLIESKILIGQTKKGVKSLLGDEYNNSDKDSIWSYDLGVKPISDLDDDLIIIIKFKNDKVYNVYESD